MLIFHHFSCFGGLVLVPCFLLTLAAPVVPTIAAVTVARDVSRPATSDSVVVGTRFTVHSTILGEDRTISVYLPPSYDTSQQPYPVLYVLDGEQIFVPMVGLVQALQWAFRAPPLIVVGIHNVNRTRDLATAWTSAAPKGMYEGSAAAAGGADRFLAFLKTELIPEIDRRYRTTPFRVLFGHSLGALFALHVFGASPGLFSATIASSPPAFWNDNEEVHRLNTVFTRTPAVTGYLFVSAAAKEFDDTPRAVGTIDELVRMRAPSTLHAVVRTIPATDHGTALLGAAQGGLELAFIGWRLPTLVFEEGLDSIEVYYQRRSTEYGFPVSIPEGEISALASRLETRDASSARRAYQRYTALYPTSLTAWLGLARTDKTRGDLDAARADLVRASSLAASSGDPRSATIRAQVDSLSKTNRR